MPEEETQSSDGGGVATAEQETLTVTDNRNGETYEVEIADGVRVRQMRSMVSEVRAKGAPVQEEASG